MRHNPILDELYAAREKLLDAVGGDVHKYLEGVRQREASSGRLIETYPQRTIEPKRSGAISISDEHTSVSEMHAAEIEIPA